MSTFPLSVAPSVAFDIPIKKKHNNSPTAVQIKLETRVQSIRIANLNDINLKQELALKRRGETKRREGFASAVRGARAIAILSHEATSSLYHKKWAAQEEPSKDTSILLNELVYVIEELPDNVKLPWDNSQLDVFLRVLCSELVDHEKGGFAGVLIYWKSSIEKYRILFNKHPVTLYVICGLLKMAVGLANTGNERRTSDSDTYDVLLKMSDRINMHAFFLLQCLEDYSPFEQIVTKYLETNVKEFVAWYPILIMCNEQTVDDYTQIAEDVLEFLESKPIVTNQMINSNDILDLYGDGQKMITIFFVLSDKLVADKSSVKYTVDNDMIFKWLCRAYSKDGGVPLRSMRLTLNGRNIFISEGKKTLEEIGLKHCSVIRVSVLETQSATETVKDQVVVSDKPNKPKASKTKKKKGRKNKGNNKKKPASNNCYSLMTEEQKHRQQLHSKALSKVFEEAERTKFFSIRQRLNAMNLECMKPKSKKGSTKPVPPIPQSVDNPPTSGEGGKAGKSHVFVQVGEESNLYKTSKPLSNRSNQRSSFRSTATNKAIVIDLHGLTKKAALDKLDKALPLWIDMAMRSNYPFLVLVKIVHGGGNQVLEEVVKLDSSE